ncbi:hypothetical protein ROJ8625_02215 [Roseivivax jejudonensis]|uniref:Uncharacterized protein n=1 Tax=Roseivivax jejudonensis TaxID=1529041 RepID=A0A1X6ZA69_9RHOB|nr:hypothetical protein [Roseivivax jejudonensis]SLN45951.1 hypothetical protein ROJ8625_02215 [Roseivivax jejudonensis]
MSASSAAAGANDETGDSDAGARDDEESSDAFWVQLELYVRQHAGQSTHEAADALRRVAAKLEAGETVGEIKSRGGDEIGWFQAEKDT